jgi:large repetitive protein
MSKLIHAVLIGLAASVVLAAQPLSITTNQTLQRGVQDIAYSNPLQATGGLPPYSWELVIGAGTGLPPGISMSSAGLLSGTTSSTGTFTFRATVSDDNPMPEQRTSDFTLVINPTLVIAATTLPGATQGVTYSAGPLVSTGGEPPVVWTVSAGTFPPGLALNLNGSISGTPSAPGTYNFTVRATDSGSGPANQIKERATSIVVAATAIEITTASPLPAGTMGTAYSQSLTATGGVAPYVWSEFVGQIPPGLELTSAGMLAGTPTQAGTYVFSVEVMDSEEETARKQFSLTIGSGALTITTLNPLASGFVNQLYLQHLTASGGVEPQSWNVAGGSLPPGITLTANGVLTGVPSQAGTFSFSVSVNDGSSPTATASFDLRINAASLQISTNDPLPVGFVESSYATTFTATGGTAPYSWSLADGVLPSGIALTAQGVLSGATLQSGAFPLVVSVTDAAGLVASKHFVLVIVGTSPVILTSSPLPVAVAGVSYGVSLQAAGGEPPFTWSIASGSLPPGLIINSAGQISGTPLQPGVSTFTIQAGDAEGRAVRKPFAILVDSLNPTITTNSPLPNAPLGVALLQIFAASGGTAPYTWALETESVLPPGLTLASDGTLTGTPTQPGTFDFTIAVTDSMQLRGTKDFQLSVISPTLMITTESLPAGQVQVPYSFQIQASGGSSPYVWDVSAGTLPAGLTLTSAGVLQGTPTQAGTSVFTVRVIDTSVGLSASFEAANSNGSSATKEFELTINAAAPLTITTASPLPGATLNAAYSQQLAASGGTGSHTWELVSGTPPDGITLSSSGLLSGTPSQAGTFQFLVRVRDSQTPPSQSEKTFVLVAGTGSPQITTSALPFGRVLELYSTNLTAIGGTEPYTWALAAGTLPSGFTLEASGRLFGTPANLSSVSFTVRVTDRNGRTATRNLTLVIEQRQTPGEQAFEIATQVMPNATTGRPYGLQLAVRNGTAPFSWGISGLPQGMQSNLRGEVFGTPTTAGAFPIHVTVAEAGGGRSTREFTFRVVTPGLLIETRTLGQAVSGTPFSHPVTADGGRPPYRWSAEGLPPGLQIASDTGVISGIPSAAGSSTVLVQVADADNRIARATYPLQVITQFEIMTAIGNLAINTPFSVTLVAAGGQGPLTWAQTEGSLPPGVTLSTSGVVSGSPSGLGDFNFTVQVQDEDGATASRSYAVRVVEPLRITTEATPAGSVDVPYSMQLTASGGFVPYTWSIADGDLPAGLSLTPTGEIRGTPTAAGATIFRVQVAEAGEPPLTAQKDFTIQISPPALSDVTIPVPANPQPQQQPPITLDIGQPYPLDLNGTLTLTFEPNAANNADDPAIQFVTGGRTAQFTIPAGQTQAVFSVANFAIQTGTTAGTITLTATLQAGGSEVDCNCELTRTIVIPRTAATITGVQVERSAGGFSVIVNGFSTSREITQGTFRFSGTNLEGTEFTTPLTATFNSWFQSEASREFGGAFTLTFPFTIQGDGGNVNSVSVTLTNSVGASQPVTANF